MKATMKILSLALVLIMAISVVILPVNARVMDTDGTDHRTGFTMSLTKETKRLDLGSNDPVANNIYRLDVTLSTKRAINNFNYSIMYDLDKFMPVFVDDDYTSEYGADMEYTDVLYEKQGVMADNRVISLGGRDKGYMPNHTQITSNGGGLKAAHSPVFNNVIDVTFRNFHMGYEPCNLQNEPIVSIYFKLKSGQTAEGAVFSVRDTKQVGIDKNPKFTCYWDQKNVTPYNILDTKSILTPSYTYHETNVSFLKNQIMFDKDEAGAFAKSYKVRTCAQIPATVAKESITEAGFLFFNGDSMDLALAQKDVESALKAGLNFGGTTENGYTFAPVSYIQAKADSDYMFTCIVENITVDEGELQVLGYAMIDGKLEFFDATNICDFNVLYNGRWAAAATEYGWDATAPDLPNNA